ncbi:MAG TPA: HAD family phosphatase [Solirubrobacteraceae bacterium]|nr:HAD family phosphatase [Solirubrobacteraceae bacterium]
MRWVDAVVFDLDGVLLESEQVWSAAKRELTREQGGSWKPAAEREMLGMSSTEWSRYMRDELSVGLEPAQISEAVAELVAARYRAELPLIPGADEAVRALAARFPLGLASSSNRQTIDLVLELTGWRECFSATTSSEEVAHGKPAPDVYLETARRLGASPERCAAVEDSDAGIRSALAAGMTVVAIPNRAYPPDPATVGKADAVLDSLAQLEGAISSLSAR